MNHAPNHDARDDHLIRLQDLQNDSQRLSWVAVEVDQSETKHASYHERSMPPIHFHTLMKT